MSDPFPDPPPVFLVCSLLYADGGELSRVRERLITEWGPEAWFSPELPFTWTRYYEAEMGGDLRRRFTGYRSLISRDAMPGIKHQARAVEGEFAADGRRRVNIDPGYISLENLVLTTFKGYSHRIYIGRSVYAEVTLMYERGGFIPLAWTYPDYAAPDIRGCMNEARSLYKDLLAHTRETR